MEMLSLSKSTGDPKYADAAMKALDLLIGMSDADGLVANDVSYLHGQPSGDEFSIGGRADSYYEYLLKVWLLGGQKDDKYREAFDRAMDGVRKRLLGKQGGFTFLGKSRRGRPPGPFMEHLACFFPGLLVLGAETLPRHDPERAQWYIQTAEELTETCYQMYKSTPIGIGPEASIMSARGIKVYDGG
jgi:hypothetical protein